MVGLWVLSRWRRFGKLRRSRRWFWSLLCSVLFRLACCALMNAILSSINPSPGVARQLLTFFVSPKKVSKERRPRDPAPSGCPAMRSKKWEGKTTRFAQTFFPSLSIFRIASPAGSKRNGRTGSLRLARGGLAFGIVASSTDDAENFISTSSLRRPSERWDPVTSVRHSTIFTTLGSNFRWNDEANEAAEEQTISLPRRCAASPYRSPLGSSRWRQVQIG